MHMSIHVSMHMSIRMSFTCLVCTQAMESKSAKSGEDIIKQGADGDYFYVLASGSASAYVKTGSDPAVKVL